MTARKNKSGPRGVVLLAGYDADGNAVVEQTLSVVDYYEELHPIIDDRAFLVQHGIRSVAGKIYDYDDKLDQQFKTEYDSAGTYVGSRIIVADGTVQEDRR